MNTKISQGSSVAKYLRSGSKLIIIIIIHILYSSVFRSSSQNARIITISSVNAEKLRVR